MWGHQTHYTIRRIDRFVLAFVEGNAILYVGTAGPEDTFRRLNKFKDRLRVLTRVIQSSVSVMDKRYYID
jgi:hypothetical protein